MTWQAYYFAHQSNNDADILLDLRSQVSQLWNEGVTQVWIPNGRKYIFYDTSCDTHTTSFFHTYLCLISLLRTIVRLGITLAQIRPDTVGSRDTATRKNGTYKASQICAHQCLAQYYTGVPTLVEDVGIRGTSNPERTMILQKGLPSVCIPYRRLGPIPVWVRSTFPQTFMKLWWMSPTHFLHETPWEHQKSRMYV